MTELPKITIVVPIRNEGRFIRETIGKILEQDYPSDKLEVIVACGDSDDNSAEIVSEIAARDSRVKLFPNPIGLASGGRNIGIKNAGGEIIIFIDGHTYIPNDQILKNTAFLIAEKGVSILSRPQFLETPDNTVFQLAVAMARRSAIGHGLDSTIYTDKELYVDPTSSGASYKKEIFDKIGYFDERFDACEDVEFNYRASQAGYKSFTSMKLAIFYYPRETLGGLFAQMKRYGIGRFRLARKHRGTLTAGTLIPALLMTGLPLLAILSIFFPIFLYPLIFLLFLYAVPIILWSMVLSVTEGLKYFLFLPLIYPAIHFGLGWGVTVELLRTIAGRGIKFDRGEK